MAAIQNHFVPVEATRWLVYVGPHGPWSFRLDRPSMLVGRDPGRVHILLPSPTVSRCHARISFDFERSNYYVKDLGSSHGTFVNDRPVELQPLADRDEVRFALCRFLVVASPVGRGVRRAREASVRNLESDRRPRRARASGRRPAPRAAARAVREVRA